jgi:hypothetical protein
VQGAAQAPTGANGSKNRPHDAYPVQCRVPDYYERVCVFELKKAGNLNIGAKRRREQRRRGRQCETGLRMRSAPMPSYFTIVCH